MKTLIESIGSLIVALFVWAIWLSFVVLAMCILFAPIVIVFSAVKYLLFS